MPIQQNQANERLSETEGYKQIAIEAESKKEESDKPA